LINANLLVFLRRLPGLTHPQVLIGYLLFVTRRIIRVPVKYMKIMLKRLFAILAGLFLGGVVLTAGAVAIAIIITYPRLPSLDVLTDSQDPAAGLLGG